jgi:hypothetical protein
VVLNARYVCFCFPAPVLSDAKWKFDHVVLLHACKVMMLGSKKEGILSMPLQSGQKSASRFCLFSKVQSASPPPGNTPVYLNVYDLTPVNGYVFWVGIGIFHSGIEGTISSTCFSNNSVELTSQLFQNFVF